MLEHPSLLIIFGVVVAIMMLLDLGVFNKKSHVIGNREALTWTIVWVSLSMLFSGVIYLTYYLQDSHALAITKFAQYQSAYWIEESLSMDNLFVFILVFKLFKIPQIDQHKILYWGILGAILFRALFIFLGVGLIKLTYLPEFSIGSWHFVIPHNADIASDFATGTFYRPNIILMFFGIFLLISGIKSWNSKGEEEDMDYSKNLGSRLVHRFFKVSPELDGDKFFTIKNGVRMATPMLVVLMVIEITDLIFAVDSIPAIFAIAPNDPYILYTSNIFAILGLRSLYFLLANSMNIFTNLHYGLAIILSFIGLKMLIAPFYDISAEISLLFVALVLVLSIVTSIIANRRKINKR